MGVSEIIALVSVLIAVVALLFTIKGSKRTDVADIEKRVADNVAVNIKLDNIAKDLKETKEEIRLQRREVQELVERMAKVEASATQAHKRLDDLKAEEIKKKERMVKND